MSTERRAAAFTEAHKLLEAAVIREVKYPEWLANVMMVLKKNGKCRMCIDFIDLNKACPKDDFPLPRIDILVDGATGCEVWLCQSDEEKISFITPFGTFCFVRMPEGLRNTGSTFYHMTKVVLGDQMARNIAAYVDDIIVRSIK